jgi:hypothetical protein
MAIFQPDGWFGLPRFDPGLYPYIDVFYEIVALLLMYQITNPDTEARLYWSMIVYGHLALIAVTNYGGPGEKSKSICGMPLLPLWCMCFYDTVLFGVFFYLAAFGYFPGHSDNFWGMTGETWSFCLLCNIPLNILSLPNITFPWTIDDNKKQT